ncbi:MAG TPA: hypothetical protein VMX75_05335, partial [Spirochaetia bacterium]|nr:hypothetical protein [Spirochaetia bacterium]
MDAVIQTIGLSKRYGDVLARLVCRSVMAGSRRSFCGRRLTLALMSPVAILASVGRGYLPPFGWVILTLFLSQLIAAMGWGSWFPWSVPALFSGSRRDLRMVVQGGSD